jgi:hypothetical protein
VQYIFFNDPAVTAVRPWPGYNNHLHARFYQACAEWRSLMSNQFNYGAEPFQGFTEFDEYEWLDELESLDEFGEFDELDEFDEFGTSFEFAEEGETRGRRWPRQLAARRDQPGRTTRGTRPRKPGMRPPPRRPVRPHRPPGRPRPGARILTPFQTLFPVSSGGCPTVGRFGNWLRSGDQLVILLDEDDASFDLGGAGAPAPTADASAAPTADAPPEGPQGAPTDAAPSAPTEGTSQEFSFETDLLRALGELGGDFELLDEEDEWESPAPTQPAATAPGGSLGTLVAVVPGRRQFQYQFTPEDVLWTARFLVGEAGGLDNPGNQAVIWAMLNRYALFTNKYYPTFHQFIRAYSTPLQPVLKSVGAAKRHAHKPEFVRTGGTYTGTDVPRGQLKQFLKLQQTAWGALPASARSLAERALKGQVPNPIGNASEFASTKVYFRDKNKRWPRDFDEWQRFTEAFAASKKWVWVGPIAELDQMNNAFFIDKRVANLAPGSVRVVPAMPQMNQVVSGSFPVAQAPTGTQIEDRTAVALKSNRKGTRDVRKLTSLVLHQTAFSRGNDTTKYDRIPVHFVITPDGKIVQLHPIATYLASSNELNPRSVAVEFVGNYRDIQGRYYKPQTYGCHALTPEQIRAGRDLIKHLMKQMNLVHVLAHRQSSGTRTNDPGPEIWYHVGQWAVDNLGLKDGGPGFFVGSGQPIPNEWRQWGQIAASHPIPASSATQCRVYRGK